MGTWTELESLALDEESAWADWANALAESGEQLWPGRARNMSAAEALLSVPQQDWPSLPAETRGEILQWAAMIHLDDALESLLAMPVPDTDLLGRLRSFPNYRIVLTDIGDGPRLGLAPDGQERQLAAVFTGQAPTEAYLGWIDTYTAMKQPPKVFRQSGEKLFPELAALPVQGVVFNPKGPGPARAFGRGLLDVLTA
jgi:hypothetical protein